MAFDIMVKVMEKEAVPDFGTKKVGYVEGKYGPFECRRCRHFLTIVSGCVHPEVMADPAVKQEDGNLRYAKVEPKGCCNEWYPSKD